MQKKYGLLGLLLGLFLCLGCSQARHQQQVRLRIAAAASLEQVLEKELLPAFSRQEHIRVEGVYAGSGHLQRQLEQGLEADLFLPAAPGPLDALVAQGLVEADSVKPLLGNALVLIVPKGNPAQVRGFRELGKAGVLALGEPASVPAGAYAQAYLQHLGLWQQVRAKASLATSVSQVLGWVAQGSAQAGLVYATDAALTDQVEVVEVAALGASGQRIVYPLGLLKASKEKEAARRLAAYLQGAQPIWRRYGFTLLQPAPEGSQQK